MRAEKSGHHLMMRVPTTQSAGPRYLCPHLEKLGAQQHMESNPVPPALEVDAYCRSVQNYKVPTFLYSRLIRYVYTTKCLALLIIRCKRVQ